MVMKKLRLLSLALPGLIGSVWFQPAVAARACLPSPDVTTEDCYIDVVVVAPAGAKRCVVMLADPKMSEVLVSKNTGIDMYWNLIDRSSTGGYRFRTKGVVFKDGTNDDNNFQNGTRVTDWTFRWHNSNKKPPRLYDYAVRVTGPKNCTLDPWIKNE